MISVIVPVYKVEKYINKCVDSILQQTYKDFELILVDDGSPDRCPEICDNYAKKDKRVCVIHKENGGPSDARNTGIRAAKGNFVTYVDSDDYIARDYLETLIKLTSEYNADIAVTGIQVLNESSDVQDFKDESVYCYTGMEALENMLYQNNLDTSACAMLLPIEIAQNNLFPEGKYHEDDLTSYKYYAEADKVVVTTKPQYFYVQHSESIMHSLGQVNIDELDAADYLVKFFENNYPKLTKGAVSKKFSSYCQVSLSVPNKVQAELHINGRIKEFLKANCWGVLLDGKTRWKNKIAALAIILAGTNGLQYIDQLRIILRNKI